MEHFKSSWVDPYVKIDDPLLYVALASIPFVPALWLALARVEYNTRLLTRLFCGSSTAGCYFFAIVVFFFAVVRDYICSLAMAQQPVLPLGDAISLYVAAILFAIGFVLFWSSFFRLGVTGTYHGDHFGLLLNERITGFPFNICNDPMYLGRSLAFFGYTLYSNSPAGWFFSTIMFLCYQIVGHVENTYTSEIYSQAAIKKSKKSK